MRLNDLVLKQVNRIKKDRGETDKSLGDKCGYSQTKMSRIMNGIRLIDMDVIEDFATAMDVSVVDLLGQKGFYVGERLRKFKTLESKRRHIVSCDDYSKGLRDFAKSAVWDDFSVDETDVDALVYVDAIGKEGNAADYMMLLTALRNIRS